MSQPSADQPVEFVGGLYWRKNMWNARATVPVILRVSGGKLSMKDENGTVFDVPCADVQAKLSRLKTLTLHADGQKYALVGRGGQISKWFPPQLEQELEQALQQGPGTTGAAGVGHWSVKPMDVTSLGNTGPWKQVLSAAGAQVS
ncbi:MAG: hypothetical protein ACRDPH_01250 [Marmoricola sp.]